jgi:DNA ligase-1
MNRFAELLDRLVLTPSRNGKLTLLTDYFRETPDPDRGLALAAITGDLDIAAVKPAMLRMLVVERMDPVLFGYSYDYVGDLAETVSLVWPEPEHGLRANREPTLAEVVDRLQNASRSDGPTVLAAARQRRHFGPLRHHQAGDRAACASASRHASPSRRWPISARSTSPRSRNCGTG